MTPDETWRQQVARLIFHRISDREVWYQSIESAGVAEEVAKQILALPAPDRSEGAEWEPHPGQYVWIEGKLTDSQPDDFPKRKRVYVHGVGTGIAKTMKPIQEAAPDRSEGLRAALQKLRDDFAGAFKSTLILALTPQGRDAVKQALADANAALAATAQVTGVSFKSNHTRGDHSDVPSDTDPCYCDAPARIPEDSLRERIEKLPRYFPSAQASATMLEGPNAEWLNRGHVLSALAARSEKGSK